MRIHALLCFGQHPGDGNPALVIEDDPRGQAERAAFARERNTTCVWIDPATEAGIAGVVDYFYPHARSPLCVHATLAVAQVLFARAPGAAMLAVRTAMRSQRLGLVREDGDYFVQMDVQEAAQPALGGEQLARLLAAPHLVTASKPRAASIGSPKLLVEVKDADSLHALVPDLAAITAWSRETGVNGMYVYCRHADGRYEGRNFNHLDHALEDSATGVAAGALTALLEQGITLLHGRATGRSGLIRTRYADGVVLVGGRVEAAGSEAAFLHAG